MRDSREERDNERSRKQTRQLTVMLLTVSVAFSLLNIPYTVFYVYANVYDWSVDPHAYAITALAQQIGITLLTINYSLNFILYCLTGQKFRQELLCMVGEIAGIMGWSALKNKNKTPASQPDVTASTSVTSSQVVVNDNTRV